MTPHEEARRMIEPRMETRYSRAKLCDEYVLTIDTAITLLASQIQRVAELEKERGSAHKATSEMKQKVDEFGRKLNEMAHKHKAREKEFEAILVEKNERIREKERLLSKIEDAIYSQFCTESNCNSNVCRVANEMLSQILSLFPAPNSQQEEKAG